MKEYIMKLQTVLKTVTLIAVVLLFALASYDGPAVSRSIAPGAMIGTEMISDTSDQQSNVELIAGGDAGQPLDWAETC
jgi:hypothetical protein